MNQPEQPTTNGTVAAAQPWEYAGEAGVDSGHMMIADPCYWVRDDRDEAKTPGYEPEWSAWTWMKMVDLLLKGYPDNPNNGVTQLNYRLGHPGLGVVIGQFGGDITGNVYVQRAPDGQVVGIQVRFDGEQPK